MTSTIEAPPSPVLPSTDVSFDVALALTSERGWPDEWRPLPHHDGVACALIDAVMSPHVRSETVAAVVGRYREAHSVLDGPRELSRSFQEYGERWPEVIGTRNRVWRSVRAPLKSDVIAQAASLFEHEHVTTCERLLDRAEDPRLRQAWAALPGQATGATWRHLLLVAGYPEPMVCRLTRRFLRRYHPLVADKADTVDVLDLMADVARTLKTPVEDIDHQMWRAGARGKPRAGASTPAPQGLG